MADSLLRLRIDSQEYDNKLKRAAEGLQRYADGCRKAGGTLEHLDDGVLEYTRSLGKMDTVSNSARGKIGEMTKAFTDLSVEYKQLTDQEKASPFGKALSESLDQLKVRVQSAKQDLDEINKSLNGESSKVGGGLFSGDKLDGMLQVFGGNLMTKAAGWAASFAVELGDCVKQGIELAKQGEGIRMAFDRLGRGDILQGLRDATHGTVTDLELMKAAVQFNDFKLPLEELSTMLAFAQQKAKDTGQSVDYMTNSIVTGLGRKSVMILDNLGISATEVKERMKETGDMTKAVGDIIREQMEKAGEYVETAADKATQADVKLKNAMEDLGRTFQPLTDSANSMWTDIKVGALDLLNNAVRPLIDALTEAGRIRSQYAQQGGDSRVNRQLERLRGISTMQYRRNTYSAQLSNYDLKIGSYEQYLSDYKKWQGDKTAVGAYDRMQAFQKQTGLSMYSDVKEQLEVFKKMRSEYVMGAKSIIAETPAPSPTTAGGSRTGGSRSVGAGSVFDISKISFNPDDVLKSGDYKAVPSVWEQFGKEIGQSLMDGIKDPMSNLQVDDFIKSYQAVEDQINDMNNALAQQKMAYNMAGQAAQNFGAALQSIDDPAAKAAGQVVSAIASIALGFAMASSSANTAGTGWGWLAWLGAGMAAMATTISTIHSLTGYAEGGMIKGNSYSGDNIGGLVDGSQLVGLNAGEIVLNQAQTSNVANALKGGGMGNMHLTARLDGKDLLLSIDRTGQTMGYGQLVFFK